MSQQESGLNIAVRYDTEEDLITIDFIQDAEEGKSIEVGFGIAEALQLVSALTSAINQSTKLYNPNNISRTQH
jgi:hypothetical protein